MGIRDLLRGPRNENFPASSCEYGARYFHPYTRQELFLGLSVSRTECHLELSTHIKMLLKLKLPGLA